VGAVGDGAAGAQRGSDERNLRQLLFSNTGLESGHLMHINAIWALSGEGYCHRDQFLVLLGIAPSAKASSSVLLCSSASLRL
jgi:hypothetical protein